MIEEYNILTAPFSIYVGLNWFFCLACAAWIISLFSFRRYLFVKPSILLLTYSHVFFQWPLAFYSGYFEKYLPEPYIFALLIHTYIVFGLLVFPFTFDSAAKKTWERISGPGKEKIQSNHVVMVLLGALIIGITFVYLSQVPLSQTGLYAIIFQPKTSGLAREKSLKLLGNVPLRYAFALMISSLAPLFAVMSFWALRNAVRKWRILSSFLFAACLLGVAGAVGLPGARVNIVNMILVMFMASLFYHGLPFRPAKFILLIGAILLLPTVLTILREGNAISLENLFEYFWLIVNRTFVVPMNVGAWYIHHAQLEGGFGIAGVPKLAALLGIEAIDAPNYIGLKYVPGALSSVSAGAGYLFTYYSYFGTPSLVISVIGLWFLDIAVLLFERLSDYLLLPCVAAVSLTTLAFISGDYTTGWVTHGFCGILAVSWFMDRGIRCVITLNQAISSSLFRGSQKEPAGL